MKETHNEMHYNKIIKSQRLRIMKAAREKLSHTRAPQLD